MLKLLATLVAMSMLQRFGDLLVGGIVLALVAFGAQSGLFLAVLAGMHAMVSLVVALAFAEPLAAVLVSFELPALYAFPAAFGLLLIGTAVGIRLAVGGYVPADVVRFAPAIDKLGGGLVGAVAGMIVAGTFLITCSIAPVPEAFRIDGSKLGYDMGTKMLRTFARCVEPDGAKRAVLLDGEPGSAPPPPPPNPEAGEDSPHDKDHGSEKNQKHGKQDKKAKPESEKTPEPPPPPPPQWSEPFADLNGNKTHDEGEPYLDTDRNSAFTPRLTFDDANGNGKRDVGLFERYRMHAWGHHVISVMAMDELPVEEAAPADGGQAEAAQPPEQ
jgi:uncharacterized membrane protein required for colicin V production